MSGVIALGCRNQPRLGEEDPCGPDVWRGLSHGPTAWPSFGADSAIPVREDCPKALFKALEISGSEPTAQGLG